jgi:hypothetical protein
VQNDHETRYPPRDVAVAQLSDSRYDDKINVRNTARTVAALTVGCFGDNLLSMQTTIQLDETLFDQATKLAQAKGCDLLHFIEETLRDKIAPKPLVAPQPFFRLTTVGGQGVRPGVDLNNSTALLALMERGA